jgi:hypothetical protein
MRGLHAHRLKRKAFILAMTTGKQNMKKLAILLGCLSTLSALAQTDPIGSVQTRADTWQKVVLQEKLFAHTDKSFYLAGEILWCRLYCMDGNTHRPLDVSKIAYVEILDANNKPVQQGKIALDKGFGEGSFFIPPSVVTGSYQLRAYTNWMKNFGPETFFTQPLTIVNTIKGIDTAAILHQDSINTYTLDFFPEGGDLIAGLPANVAFEALNDQGQGIDAQGALLTGTNDTLLTFRPQQQGMGSFHFTPADGQSYKAVMRCPDGSTHSWSLPPVIALGYTLHLHEDNANITLVARASHGLNAQNTWLFVHSGTWSAFSDTRAIIAGDSITFVIPRNKLQPGDTRFTLFDAVGRPQAERQFFTPPHDKLNITVNTDKEEYTTRQKLTLDIASSDTANLSVAVYRLDSLQGYPPTDLLRYLYGTSEYTGQIPSTKIFDDPALADLYSLTRGWTRFRWADVLSHPSGPRIYPPEIRGQLITGRLSDPHTGSPAKEITTWLSTPGLAFQFASTQTDSGGKFQFDIKDFYGADGIVIHTGTEGYPYKVDAFSPFSEQFGKDRLPLFKLSRSQFHLLTKHSVGMQVLNVYTGDSLKRYSFPDLDTIPFFGRSDYSYLMDNYTRFTTMEEVLREYVREINITKTQGHLHLVMLNEPFHSTFNDNKTLVLVDGVPVTNDRVFNYDPLKVKRLDVIPREYILGPSHFSGVASFTTYKGDFEGLELDTTTLQLEYEGLQYPRQFYTPAYKTNRQAQGRLPDFRNVLYWSPRIRTAAKPTPVEFYTSDLPGEYLIVIQGLSPNGRAGVTYKRFTVRPGAMAIR